MNGATAIARRRGGPLMMLALVLTAWTGARAVWWENPFVPLSVMLAAPIAALDPAPDGAAEPYPTSELVDEDVSDPATASLGRSTYAHTAGAGLYPPTIGSQRARLAAAQQMLWHTALRQPLFQHASVSSFALTKRTAQSPPPFLPPQRTASPPPGKPSRWSLDAWAFWRQGSNAAPVSQGRVPIYGASQIGTVLQYRVAALAERDPRLYVRGYRALVTDGESELALGASIRPVAALPLRMAGEVRYTDAAFTNELRPSAYVVTELPPIRLPYGAQMEAYGQAGWVGGASATAFADGQATVTREVDAVSEATGEALRVSLGAGAWGGAQSDAQRIDVGPTMRFDLTLGEVPARISVDWRERVGGQAGPDSGLAATLSARF
jgi:hypothetical protein